jgi:cytochrome c biogenesis protein CcdA
MSHVKKLQASTGASLLLSSFIAIILAANLFFIPLATAQSNVSLHFFYAHDCSHCRDVLILVEQLQGRHPEVDVHTYVLTNSTANSELFNELIQAYNPQAVDLPAVFIGNSSLMGYKQIKNKLEHEMVFCLHHDCPDPLSRLQAAEEHHLPVIFMLIGTALIEGINPCGIAVLIVLLASLLLVKSKRGVLIMGMSFIASVFATHVFIGIGVLEFYHLLDWAVIMRGVVIVIVIPAGILNIMDFWRDKPSLAIPSFIKPTLGTLARYASIPGAVLLGSLATIAGFPCTGPVYLAMLEVMSGLPQKTFFNLLLYNLLYVVPPLVILIIIYKGTAPEDAEEWRKGTRRYMKLIGGLAMLVLGIPMLFGYL